MPSSVPGAKHRPALKKALNDLRPMDRLGLAWNLDQRGLYDTQRILEINALNEVTKTVVEAARENLVIGEA